MKSKKEVIQPKTTARTQSDSHILLPPQRRKRLQQSSGLYLISAIKQRVQPTAASAH